MKTETYRTYMGTKDGVVELVPHVPVKHGKWISHEGYEECNLCHRKVTFPYNYCPNCGARMDGE